MAFLGNIVGAYAAQQIGEYNATLYNQQGDIDTDKLVLAKLRTDLQEQGVQLTERLRDKCIGINSSTIKRDIIGTYNPTVTEMGKNNKDLHAMFDLSRGIPSNRQSIKLD